MLVPSFMQRGIINNFHIELSVFIAPNYTFYICEHLHQLGSIYQNFEMQREVVIVLMRVLINVVDLPGVLYERRALDDMNSVAFLRKNSAIHEPIWPLIGTFFICI